MKAIKRRIASVDSTQQIMKAMNLVAASKLQRAKAQLSLIRPLYSNIKQVMDGVKSGADLTGNIFFESREVKNAAYLVISGDRGLCGGYNLNISKEAMSVMERVAVPEKVFTVGSKAYDYLRKRNKNIIERCTGVTEATAYEKAQEIGGRLLDLFKSGEVDEIYMVYTHFETILSQEPKSVRVLPLGEDEPAQGQEKPQGFMLYDPDVHTFLEYAMPMYVNTLVYGAIIESNVCEQASRMTSMDAAARNAEEIVDDLTLAYNRKRQGAITQEITEIVSGANAIQ
jgi:F-type H+-transporting ATPase subunit gamma